MASQKATVPFPVVDPVTLELMAEHNLQRSDMTSQTGRTGDAGTRHPSPVLLSIASIGSGAL